MIIDIISKSIDRFELGRLMSCQICLDCHCFYVIMQLRAHIRSGGDS